MYFVYKTIKGRRYLYWQRSYRVGRKVKTEGGSLGHVPWEVNATCGYETMRRVEIEQQAYRDAKAGKENGSKESVSKGQDNSAQEGTSSNSETAPR